MAFGEGEFMYGQFFLLFGLIVVGYYCNKKGWLDRETNKNMGAMVMHVTIPALIVSTIANIEITDTSYCCFERKSPSS